MSSSDALLLDDSNRRVNVSFASRVRSPLTATLIVFVRSPGLKVSVPVLAL